MQLFASLDRLQLLRLWTVVQDRLVAVRETTFTRCAGPARAGGFLGIGGTEEVSRATTGGGRAQTAVAVKLAGPEQGDEESVHTTDLSVTCPKQPQE